MVRSKNLTSFLCGSSERALWSALALAAVVPPVGARAQEVVLPHDGRVVEGQVAIDAAPGSVTIAQASARAIIDWADFSIGAGGVVAFENGAGATLNRVTGGAISRIDGMLSATGSVFLINPQGIVVGAGGRVVTDGSFVASTRDIADDTFLSGGTLRAAGTSTGGIVNDGVIVSARGEAILVGHAVTNNGTISAPGGGVTLSAANEVLLRPAGGDARIAISGGAGGVTNAGRIEAAQAALRAAGGDVFALVKNSGSITATGTAIRDGRVWLTTGGAVEAGGTIAAGNADGSGGAVTVRGADIDLRATVTTSANEAGRDAGDISVIATGTTRFSGLLAARGGAGGRGGLVETSGARVEVAETARVRTLGDGATSGTWLIDPADYRIAATGGDISGSVLSANLEGGDVAILSSAGATPGNGDILVEDAIAWSSGATLTLTASRDIRFDADVTVAGGGGVVLTTGADGDYRFAADAALSFTGGADAGASLTINGESYTLVHDLDGLRDVSRTAALGGRYALAGAIDAAAATEWSPIGTAYGGTVLNGGNGFSGSLTGLGHMVSGLTYSGNDYVGLFGYVSGTVRDLGVTGGSYTLVSNTRFGAAALVGYLATGGVVRNAYATSDVHTSASARSLGGLVGYNDGTIADSYATGAVTAPSSGTYYIGGLVGTNAGTITGSHATGEAAAGLGYVGGLVGQNSGLIADSHADGAASGLVYVGGLVGHNSGTIRDSHAGGAARSTSDEGYSVGGLVGHMTGGAIIGSHATGTADGPLYTGGLVGQMTGGSVSGSHATGAVTGDRSLGGLIGRATSGTITVSASHATGDVTGGTDSFDVGGLIGTSYAAISDSYATGAVRAEYGQVGGLVGTNHGDIHGSHATGQVVGAYAPERPAYLESRWAGGLVGRNQVGALTDVYATGAVSAHSQVGGLVGEIAAGSSIVDSRANGRVRGTYNVGGLVGAAGAIAITRSRATGDVTGNAGAIRVGGLVGSSDATISGSHATGVVSGGDLSIGGLVGLSVGDITDSYASGDVTTAAGHWVGGLAGRVVGGAMRGVHASGAVTGNNEVGGLIGSIETLTTVSDSHATGTVTGEQRVGGFAGTVIGTTLDTVYATGDVIGGASYGFGGLVGYIATTGINTLPTVSGSFATGRVSGTERAGGLIGYGSAIVRDSHATGDVVATGEWVGGLMGETSGSTEILRTYASGDVTGSANVGGLIGLAFGSVKSSYALGAVTGTSDVGGLVGYNRFDAIDDVYASGAVRGDTNVGGLVGTNLGGSVTGAYWDVDTTGQAQAVGRTESGAAPAAFEGIATAGARDQATYSEFDFASDWVMLEGLTRPMLRSEYSTTIYSAHQLQLVALDLTADYSVGADIDMTGRFEADENGNYPGLWGAGGFVPLGTDGNGAVLNLGAGFSGTVDGGYHLVTGLTIARGSDRYTGLFGSSSGTVRAIGLVGGSVAGAAEVGALVGANYGTVAEAFSFASVSGGTNVGGLVGYNEGTVRDSYAGGGVGALDRVGGLVGLNQAGGEIRDSYAAGAVAVNDGGEAGGLVGSNYGSVSDSVWNVETTGRATSAGSDAADGLTTAAMQSPDSFAAWDLDAQGGTDTIWRIYDGNSAPLLRGFLTPLFLDAVTTTYTGKAQFGYVDAGVYAFDSLFSDQFGHDLISLPGAALTIEAAPLTIRVHDATRTYDGGAFSGGSVTYSGFVEGEDSAVLSGSLGYGGTAQGAADAGSYSITASGLGSNNYAITYQAGTLTIDPATLTVTLTGTIAKTYDRSAEATPTQANYSLGGLVGGDAVTLSFASALYGDPDAGSGKTVSLTGLALGGADAANYRLSATSAAADIGTIAARALAVETAGTVVSSRMYDGTREAQVLTHGTLAGVIEGDAVTLSLTGTRYADADAGTGKTVTGSYLLGGSAAGNYRLASDAFSALADITRAPLVARAKDGPLYRTYDTTAFSGGNGMTYEGFVAGEDASDLGGALVWGGDAQGAVDAGTYSILPSGLTSDNYDIRFEAGTLLIEPAPLAIAPDALSRAYGDANPELTWTYMFADMGLFMPYDDGSVVTGALGTTATAASPVGTYEITEGTLSAGPNYMVVVFPTVLTVTPRPITVTANDLHRSYGDANPELTYTVGGRGLANGDRLSGALATPATAASGVGHYAIGRGTLDDSNYAITFEAGTLTVDPRALTITALDVAKTYGEGLVFDGSEFRVDGLVAGDSVASVDLASGGAAAAADVTPAPYAITASGATGTGLGNYAIAYAAGSLTVNPATLTAALAGSVSRGYDGTVGAALTGDNFTLSGVLHGDIVLPGTASGVFDDRHAGTGKTVSVTGLTLAGADAGNYRLASEGLSAAIGTITPATLTPSFAAPVRKTYDGTTAAPLAASDLALTGVFGSDEVTLGDIASADFASAAAGSDKMVSVSGLTLAGADAGNYRLGATALSAAVGTIDRALVTAGLIGEATKTYDTTVDAWLEASQLAVTGLVAGDSVAVTFAGTARYDTADAGSGKTVRVSGLTLSGADAGNYALATTEASGAIGTITPATLTASLTGKVTRTYDGGTAAAPGMSNFRLDGVLGDDGVFLSGYGTGRFADADAGTGKLVSVAGLALGGGAAANYVLAADSVSAAIGTIERATLVVTAADAARLYDGTRHSGGSGVTISGFAAGEDASVLGGALRYGGSAQGAVDAGSYAIAPDGLSAANYRFDYRPGTLTIAPRPLMVKADDLLRVYGDANPVLGWTASGLIDGDSLTGALATSADARSGVGRYAIEQGSLAASANYRLAFEPGVLAVTPRPLTVVAQDASRLYGEANPTLSYSVSGLVNGDLLGGALATAAGATSDVGDYAIGQGSLVASPNYRLSFEAGTLTVTPRPLVVAADDLSRSYGDANPALTYSASGLVNGDRLSGALATDAVAGSGVGSYAIRQGSLAASPNYALSYRAGALTVTPRPLTITANDLFAEALESARFTARYSGFAAGDTSAIVAGLSFGVFPVSGAPLRFDIVPFGATAPNYAIDYTRGLLTLEQPVDPGVLQQGQGATQGRASFSMTGGFGTESVADIATIALGSAASGPGGGEAEDAGDAGEVLFFQMGLPGEIGPYGSITIHDFSNSVPAQDRLLAAPQ